MNPKPGDKPLRVAVVGAGIGSQHVAGYLELPGEFSVEVVCELDEARAKPLAEKAGARIETDLAVVLADPAIDIIDVCLPPSMHVPVSIDALAAGKHVVCEKPIAGSLEEADRLVEAEKSSDFNVYPVFQYRFGPGLHQLRALREAGLLGRPQVAAVETHWDRKAGYYDNPWRGTWSHEMGGAVLSHAIHSHDLLCHFFDRVSRVAAIVGTRINSIETEDCAAISFVTESGAMATSSITLGAAGDTSRLKFVFENLTAESGSNPYAPGNDPWRFTARDEKRQAEVDACVSATGGTGPEGYAGLFQAVADSIHGGSGANAVTLEDARHSVELVTAIYQSSREGGFVDLPLAPDSPLYSGWISGTRE